MRGLSFALSALLCLTATADEGTFQAPFKDLKPPVNDVRSNQKNLTRKVTSMK